MCHDVSPLAFLSSNGWTQDLVIIGSGTIEARHLTKNDVARLFLGLGSTDLQATPVDRDDSRLRERFYRTVAGLSPASVRAHWAKRVFTGRGRPPVMQSEAKVQELIAGQGRIITYAPTGDLPSGATVLLHLDTGSEP